ncbi:MAG TPA: tetratricopeptide repeat protein [Pirellulales bacterium]|jgi:tetratricopeptide (TPR) repeat protein|nr:tetratricopeptide repeat protein [Pirellulales bacterium]
MSPAVIQSQPTAQQGSQRRADTWRAVAICGFLVLAVLLVFGRTLSYDFVNFDDDYFVRDEPHVANGLTWSGIVWAFTDGPLGEWYPLSMLSHMLDCQLYGPRPAGHHLTNLLLHASATVALFLVLRRMTGELWPSALVAALFAIHPLHVESVAWVSELRDVLSALCFMLTLGAYGEYVRRQSIGSYLAVVGFFALGLMSKPMLVTVPPLLLLLDFWPLGRLPGAASNGGSKTRRAPFPWRVVLDKLPLLAMAIALAVVTLRIHGTPNDRLTFSERFGNAAISCVAYLGQLFVPVGLSIFYSFPEAPRPAWQAAAALALLLAITAAAVAGRRSYPYFFVGWFWYIGLLVPVLELIPVGAHARADRYTYLSQIGLYIALVWGAMRLAASWPARRWVFGIGSAIMLVALMACAWRQTGYWRNSQTLWQHAVLCDPKSAMAHFMLGKALAETDEKSAAAQYRLALEIGPHERIIYRAVRAKAHNSLGNLADQQGDTAGAIAHYEQAAELDVNYLPAQINLGNVLAKQGDFDKALICSQRAVELSHGSAAAYCNLAVALARLGKTDEAIASCRKAVEADPKSDVAHSNLAILLAQRDDNIDEAIVHFRRAIELAPDAASNYQQVAMLLRKQGKTNEAARYDERGLKASRRRAQAHNLRGTELMAQDKLAEAIAQFKLAVAVFPDLAQAHANLADALARQGNLDEAIAHYRRALQIDPNLAAARQSLERLSNR